MGVTYNLTTLQQYMLDFKTIEKYQTMLGYIDFYTFLIDKDIENFAKYIQTKNKKFLNQSKETREMLLEEVKKGLNDDHI